MEAGFNVGPPVHGGRFLRRTAASGQLERACKLYVKAENGAYVLVASHGWAPPGKVDEYVEKGDNLARVRALCDTADLVLEDGYANKFGEDPSKRWIVADREERAGVRNRILVCLAALDAAMGAGAKRIALFYDLPFTDGGDLDTKLRERHFEVLAEWWTTFD
jgi:hypothetical protein